MKEALERWPKLREIGDLDAPCGNEEWMELITCAYYILYYSNWDDTVTPFIQYYDANPTLAAFDLVNQTLPELYDIRHAPVYDYYGEILTIDQASVRSMNILDGETIKRNLWEVVSNLAEASLTDENEALRAYPAVVPFLREKMQFDGLNLELNIGRSLMLVQIPFLETKLIKDRLASLNQGFLEVETMVDDCIAENWPNLAPFRNIGRLTFHAERYTIREMAKMVCNLAMELQRAKTYLNNLENSAAVSSQDIEQTFDSYSASVEEAQRYYLEHIPGGQISLYTAMHYSLLSALPLEEGIAWENEVDKAINALRKNRVSNRAIQHAEESGRIEGSMLRAAHGTAQRSAIESSNTNLIPRSGNI